MTENRVSPIILLPADILSIMTDMLDRWHDHFELALVCKRFHRTLVAHPTSTPFVLLTSHCNKSLSFPSLRMRNMIVDTAFQNLSRRDFRGVYQAIRSCPFVTTIDVAGIVTSKSSRHEIIKALSETNPYGTIFVSGNEISSWVYTAKSIKDHHLRITVKKFDNVIDDVSDSGDAESVSAEPSLSLDITRTPPQSATFNSKRPNVDFYRTPESVKKRVMDMKNGLKAAYAEQDQLLPRNHPTLSKSRALPRSLDKLVTENSTYHYLDQEFDTKAISSIHHNSSSTVNAIISEHANKLIECVLLGQVSWIFVTCVDAYLINNPHDDCAMSGSDHDGYTKPEAIVIEKTHYRDRWNELVIRWGPVEFLVMAAYYGQRSTMEKQAFLGSVVPKSIASTLKHQGYEVLVRQSPPSIITSQRHLRNYCKHGSAHLWSYSSESFASVGFRPMHPLAIDHHQTRTRSKHKDKASLASLVLNVVVSRHFRSDDRYAALTILESTKEFKHISTTEWSSVSTIENALSIFERTVPNAGILHPLRILNRLDILPQSEHCRISHLLNDTKIRADILTMYNQSIAHTLKSYNQKTLKGLVI